MSDKIHGFPKGKHEAKVNKHVHNIPGKASGKSPAGGVIGHPGDTPGMHGYGPHK